MAKQTTKTKEELPGDPAEQPAIQPATEADAEGAQPAPLLAQMPFLVSPEPAIEPATELDGDHVTDVVNMIEEPDAEDTEDAPPGIMVLLRMRIAELKVTDHFKTGPLDALLLKFEELQNEVRPILTALVNSQEGNAEPAEDRMVEVALTAWLSVMWDLI